MGYNIKVDHSKFDKAANAIETYNSTLSKKMGSANQTVTGLLSSWKGIDASSYKTKWDALDETGSVYYKMRKSLDSYAKFLRTAGNKYKTAQANAINRAKKLPKW